MSRFLKGVRNHDALDSLHVFFEIESEVKHCGRRRYKWYGIFLFDGRRNQSAMRFDKLMKIKRRAASYIAWPAHELDFEWTGIMPVIPARGWTHTAIDAHPARIDDAVKLHHCKRRPLNNDLCGYAVLAHLTLLSQQWFFADNTQIPHGDSVLM
jgi:hypothetical protein